MYAEEITGDKHRYKFIPLRLKNKDFAVDGELVVDPETGDVYVAKTDPENPTKVVLTSATAGLLNEIKSLRELTSASPIAAYVNNADVYKVYKSDSKVRLDEMLRLSKGVRYWALRGTNSAGNSEYLTGTIRNGSVENSLVDVVHDTTVEGVEYTGKAAEASLHTPTEVVEGKLYFIDFFDSERKLISSMSAQVIEVESLSFASTPEYNVTKIVVHATQEKDFSGTTKGFLYKGQTVADIDLWVEAGYSDGSSRLINNQGSANPRLVFNWSTTDLSEKDVGDEITVTAKYFVGEVPDTINGPSIDAELTIQIVEDVFDSPKALIPVPYITKVGSSDKLSLKTFAQYENRIEYVGNSDKLTVQNLIENKFDAEQQITLKLRLGHGSDTFDEVLDLCLGADPHHQITKYGLTHGGDNYKSASPLTYTPVVQVDTINGNMSRWMRVNADPMVSSNVSDTYTPNCHQKGSVDALRTLGTVGADEPTHIEIRSLIKPSFMYTCDGPVSLEQAVDGFVFDEPNGAVARLDAYKSDNDEIPYPVLVIFEKISTVDGERVVKTLGAVPAFISVEHDFMNIA